MNLQNRSYNPGNVFRPKPVLLERSDLLIVVTSWSVQSEAETVAHQLLEQVELISKEDLTSLNSPTGEVASQGERLRAALVMMSQSVYKKNNSKQARLLLEALVLQRQGNSILWAQVGQPNLFLLREGKMATLTVQSDHSILDPGLPPLPQVGLGLESQTTVHSGVVRLSAGDQLLLLAQSWIPTLPDWKTNPSFRDLTTELINRRPDLAFWCGVMEF